jgi:RNA polymerase sigma factor (sigma-70 family)
MPGKKYSEEDLVSLLQKEDKVAFSYLYDNYSAALYGIILKILNQDEEAAEDILQDVFIKIWKKIAFYDSKKGTLFTWMLNIARNTAIDKIRSLKSISIQSIDYNVHNVDRLHQQKSAEDNIGIKEMVNKLKPDYKSIIDLAYFSGYTQEEISKELNLPLGTVKTRARAALIELRKALK